MLQLPIRQRGPLEPEPKDQALPKAGRQLLFEALGQYDGSENEQPKMTIKNTFIEVDTPEDKVDVSRGSQTCSARMEGPSPSFGQSPTIPEASPPELVEETPVSMGSSLPSPEDNGLKVSMRNTFIDVRPVMEETPLSASVTQSCAARLSAATPQHLPAPPAYAAPAGFGEERTTPPPSEAPGNAGRQVFIEALQLSEELDEAEKADDQLGDLRIVVKNTFIDVDGGQSDGAKREAKSCVARLSNPAPQFLLSPVADASHRSRPFSAPSMFGGSPNSVASASPLVAPAPAVVKQVVVSPAASFPSAGSQVHGQLLSDGTPACQPCAWFYKESGCLNGRNCRYCHLCPQGELKNRKKMKIARLRSSQEAAAEAAAAAAGEQPATAAGTSPVSAVTTVSAPTLQVSAPGPRVLQPQAVGLQPQAVATQPAAATAVISVGHPQLMQPVVSPAVMAAGGAKQQATATATPLLLSALLSSQG